MTSCSGKVDGMTETVWLETRDHPRDMLGRTFEDPDGYRIVLQNAGWPV